MADIVATGVPGTIAHPRVSTSEAVNRAHDGLKHGRLSTSTADVEAIGEKTASVIAAEQYPTPTEEESRSLVRWPTAFLPRLTCFAWWSSLSAHHTMASRLSSPTSCSFLCQRGATEPVRPPKGQSLLLER